MALESATYINGLTVSNPTATDNISEADDHLRLIKSTIKNTFPNITNAMTATHTVLNGIDNRVSTLEGVATPTFIGMSDTPGSFSGSGGYTVKVNSSGNGLQFVNEAASSTTFTGLTDTPGTMAGQGGKVVKVNSGGSALEYATESTGTTYTAGTGISIVGNQISSTVSGGTTYSAGSGISIVGSTISLATKTAFGVGEYALLWRGDTYGTSGTAPGSSVSGTVLYKAGFFKGSSDGSYTATSQTSNGNGWMTTTNTAVGGTWTQLSPIGLLSGNAYYKVGMGLFLRTA